MESNRDAVSTTQELLKSAFIDLYSVKPLNKISINELVSACHVSRGTFYLYYTNILQLLENIETDFLNGIMSLNSTTILEALKRNPDMSTYTKPYSEMLSYIINNKKTFQALLNGSESLSFRRKYLDNIKRSVITMFEIDRQVPEKYRELSCAFHAGGVISLFEAWMNENFQSDPVKIASIVYKALFIGLLNPAPTDPGFGNGGAISCPPPQT